MEYLKPIVSKITKEDDIVKYIKSTNNDKEAMEYLLEKGFKKNDITDIIEKYYGVSYVDLEEHEITNELITRFDREYLEKNYIIPYKEDAENKMYYFIVSDILNQGAIKNITNACKSVGYTSVFGFSLEHEIVKKYSEIKNNKLVDTDINFDAQNWVTDLIDEGIKIGASDIHIERLEGNLKTRYRVDGILTNEKVFNYSESILSSIYVRLKIISGMDISEKRKPQDGRIDNHIYDNTYYDMRVSSVNTIYGEKIVIRIFEKTKDIQSFNELGFNEENEQKIKRMLKNKNGIIYIGGATGSGKTTTLYSMVDEVNTKEVNIYTIENPVEKTIKNVNQIQINNLAGIDYVSTLKALLRQDPDIIVVGEIRDSETADLSNRASLTGHLVLSTIHTNNAIDTISRLLDMQIEPYILSAGTIGILSQRLVRALCPHCKEKVDTIFSYEKAWLEKVTEENCIDEPLGTEFYRNVGCSECRNGYKGRVAVIEILEMDEEIRSLVSRKSNINEIKEAAIKNGFKPLVIDGINKALQGVTTIEELIRHLN